MRTEPEVLHDTGLAALLEVVPRVVLEPSRAWLDIRGLEAAAVHAGVRRRLEAAGWTVRSGAGANVVAARVAAESAGAGGLVVVEAGSERSYLSGRPLSVLGLEDPLLGWLADVGVSTCGELASQEREAVEVRFGAEAVKWWRLSRGDDGRRLFAPVPPGEPASSVDFVDYVVTDPERLVFTTNALLGGICEGLRERGSHARRIRLRLPLANGTVWERTLRTARPTADRGAWLRLARALLERLTVPDAVSGVALEVESAEAAGSAQGDLFDSGFATASAVEAAVARVLEDHGPVIREPVPSGHPLVDHRAGDRPMDLQEALGGARREGNGRRNGRAAGRGAGAARDGSVARPGSGAAESAGDAPEVPGDVASGGEPVGLTLQLLPEPRPVVVETVRRRDHTVPVRYRDGRWHALVHAAGPDRVSGGRWDVAYAREYFRAVTAEGALVWLFRDASRDRWYLHGWWD